MKKRILIIDDDEELCEELSEILADNGYDVKFVNDGESARQVIAEETHDLILLDLKLPGIKGKELLKDIKRKRKSQKVIVVSGSPKVGRLSASGSLGAYKTKEYPADEVISKPFDIEYALQRITDLLKT